MATATATNYKDLRSWLQGVNLDKAAGALPEKEDEGKPATEGSRSSENSSDVKKVVPGQNIDAGKKNPDNGNADNPIPDSGLQQATTGKMPDVEKAVKTVSEESEKVASLDLTNDTDFEAAVEALTKASASLPILFAASGVGMQQVAPNTSGVNTKVETSKTDPVVAKAAADKKAAAEVTESYRKWGADRGAVVANYIKGLDETSLQLLKWANDGTMGAMLEGAPEAGAAPAGPAGPDMGAMAGAAPPPGPEMGGGDAGGGQPSLDDVAAALAEMGLSPDDLIAIAQKMQGDMGGAAAGGEGAAPEEKMAAQMLTNVIKTANDTKELMRSGKFSLKPAADGTPARKRRDASKSYIQELINMSK